MKPWFKNVTPHKDIQDGHLDESIFAANLAEVAAGTGREIYNSPAFEGSAFHCAIRSGAT